MKEKIEEWAEHPTYSGYLISTLGRVASVRIMKPALNTRGHPFLSLRNNKKSKTFQVSHLVDETFGTAKNKGKRKIEHIGEKTDNGVDNLYPTVVEYLLRTKK